MVIGLDHVQVAAPPGCEAEARAFYSGLLGLEELEKPERLRARGGCWFRAGAQELHVGVEEPFAPGRRRHPGGARRVAPRRPPQPCRRPVRQPPRAPRGAERTFVTVSATGRGLSGGRAEPCREAGFRAASRSGHTDGTSSRRWLTPCLDKLRLWIRGSCRPSARWSTGAR